MFAEAFVKGNAMRNAFAHQIDERLHSERMLTGKSEIRIVQSEDLAALPSGAIFLSGDAFFAVKDRTVLHWSFSGYHWLADRNELQGRPLRLVTPQSTIAALKSGYRPVWHESAARTPALQT